MRVRALRAFEPCNGGLRSGAHYALIDCAARLAVGLLLMSHVHDNDRIIKYSHAFLGYMFLVLGGVQGVCGLACDAAPERPIPAALQALNAFFWLLPGVWLLHM